MKYRIIKFVEAKSIKSALKLEKDAEVDEIQRVEPEEKEELTAAIGFHIDNEYSDEDDIDHGI